MPTLTTTQEFPFFYSGRDQDFILNPEPFPASVDTSEAGKLQLRLKEQKIRLPKGNYEAVISGTVKSTDLATIPLGRFSLDGGSTWENFTCQADNVTDNKLFSVTVLMNDYSGSDLDIILQMVKSSAGTGAVTVGRACVTIKRHS